MTIQVTLEQYQRLIKARENWPDRLTITAYDCFHPEIPCTVAYLGVQAGLSREAISKHGANISSHAREEISRTYGVSEYTLKYWEIFNSVVPMFGQERRSRKMLSRFEKFLNEVEVTYAFS